MTFTYASALDNPNSTLIRADWALNQQWSGRCGIRTGFSASTFYTRSNFDEGSESGPLILALHCPSAFQDEELQTEDADVVCRAADLLHLDKFASAPEDQLPRSACQDDGLPAPSHAICAATPRPVSVFGHAGRN